MAGRSFTAVALRLLLIGGVVLGGTAFADPIFSLIGSSGLVGDGTLAVAISQSGGWGFQIFNDSPTDWIASNISDFCPTGVTTPPCDANTWLLSGVDTFGPYTDFYGPNFVTVAPGATLTEQFDSGGSGVGSIALSRSGSTPGDSQSGNILFVYDLFTDDPNVSGVQIGGDRVATAGATVTATVITPEPGTSGLIAVVLLAAALFKRRHSQ